MRRQTFSGSPGKHYRRGAVMGLTVAEAFMLVAFVLLLLLLAWRHQVQGAVDLAAKLSPESQQALLEGAVPVPRKRLDELKKMERRLADPALRALAEAAAALPSDKLRKLADLARNPEALSEDTVPVPRDRLAELKDKERLLEDPARRILKDGEVAVPRERLAELKGKERLLEDPARRILKDGEVAVPREQLAELNDKERLIAGRDAAEIAKAVKLREALDPYSEDSNKALLDRIRALQAKEDAVDSRLAKEAQARRQFMEKLRRELADIVKLAGGEIGPRGRITFPDKAFFETGSAEIPARSKEFLDNICSRWLATLKESPDRFDIDEIRIEGHSSSEWADARTERDAWVENLSLSQQRAQSVLVHCLDHVGRTPLGDWARGKLTAVGYSSSRRITTGNGSENKEASRRVVLGHEVSREGLISDLGGAGEADGSTISPIRGLALVKDADTIQIGKISIRLDGIDAPERGQTCADDEESEWHCGREAGLALERHIGSRTVVCNRLRPGLARLRGRCRVAGESEDLNRWVVQAGWAFAYVKYSKDYAGDEAAARKARRGIWSGRAPMPPWEWRRNRAAAAKLPVR